VAALRSPSSSSCGRKLRHGRTGHVHPQPDLARAARLDGDSEPRDRPDLGSVAAHDVLEALGVLVDRVTEKREARAERADPEIGLQEVVVDLEIARPREPERRRTDARDGADPEAFVARDAIEIAAAPAIGEPKGAAPGAESQSDDVVAHLQEVARSSARP
jgi:hypothetical protein